jgi:hypothetical protein
MKVRHHSRQPNFPMHIELENEADLKWKKLNYL